MDVIDIRRRLLMQMIGGGDVAQVKHGIFMGNGTPSVQIQTGFAPDVLIIESDVDYSQAGWTGIGHVVIAKGVMSLVMRHNSTSTETAANNIYPIVNTGTDYGDAEIAKQYCIYGNYSDGVIALDNYSVGVGVTFNSGRQYTWTAYKA